MLKSKIQADLVSALFALLSILTFARDVWAVTQTSVTQWGITWTFDKPYEVGKFVNGDWWVLGPVVVTRITPDYDGTLHGWEVNPVYVSAPSQGFRGGIWGFNPALVPALPYTAVSGKSIIKTISRSDTTPDVNDHHQPHLLTAAVLTVVPSIPPDGGSTVFRPPYCGTAKPYYSVKNLHLDLLPSKYAPVAGTPTLVDIQGRFERVQIEHTATGGDLQSHMRPIENYKLNSTYHPYVGISLANGALRLMMNDPIEAKMPALIGYIQGGIDRYHAGLTGQRWCSGDGMHPNETLPLAFAATLLQDQGMKDFANIAAIPTCWHDRAFLQPGRSTPVWGGREYWTERKYWEGFVYPYNIEFADPYGYIDGNQWPGSGYQFCCVSGVWKGMALAFHLMPAMQQSVDLSRLLTYMDRWITIGTWTQPDPCAPLDARDKITGKLNPDGSITGMNYYGVTYGPDGRGGCILDTNPADGIGRYPGAHGTNKDNLGAAYQSSFVNAMWNAYRNSNNGGRPPPPTGLKVGS